MFLPMVALLLLFDPVKVTSLPNISWTDGEFLDSKNRVHLSWLTTEDDITMEVAAFTLGWVGIGISTHGGMRGSDIIVGWVIDGQPTIQDRFATEYAEPIIDDHQDVDLLGGWENSTHTVLRFRRKLRTCDDRDVEITDKTMRILYALNPNDPEDDHLMKHTYKGVRSEVLVNQQKFQNNWGDDVVKWEVRNPGIPIPNDTDTLYWGTPFKLIDLPSKHHIVGFAPLIAKESLPFVHHMVFLACNPENETLFEEHIGRGFELYTRQTPLILYSCVTLLLGFAIGGKGETLDPMMGLPVGDGAPNSKYFMLETHYDNRNFLNAPKADKSGLLVVLTPKLRPNDGWSLMVGHEFAHQIIPPKQKLFTSVGHCSANCTRKHFKKEGIKVLSVMPHTHLIGKTIKLSHFRNGVELPPIVNDQFYDYTLQVFRSLKSPVTILPGDNLIVECGYDSSRRSNVTWGGLPTSAEMCIVILHYYPKQDLAQCNSNPSVEDLGKFIGFNFSGQVRPLSEPAEYADVVNKFKFQPRIKEFQDLVARGPYMDVCIKQTRAEIQDQTTHPFPEITNAYVSVDKCSPSS